MTIGGYLNNSKEITDIDVTFSMFFAFDMKNDTGLQGYLPLVYTDDEELKDYNFLY
jgi:hypothetical protein